MNCYMHADLRRIFRRIPRIIALVVIYAVLAVVMLYLAKNLFIYEIVDYMIKGVPYACAAIGFVEFLSVFNEDLKARTMQIAIGIGISRRKVILAKWLECIFLCLLDGILLFALIAVCTSVRGAAFAGEPAADIALIIFFGMLKVTGSVAFTMIFVFYSQNPMVGLLVYAAMSFGIVNALAGTIVDLGPLNLFGLNRFLFMGLLNTARSRLMIGTFSVPHFAGIILYLVLFFEIAVRVFRKRELEF